MSTRLVVVGVESHNRRYLLCVTDSTIWNVKLTYRGIGHITRAWSNTIPILEVCLEASEKWWFFSRRVSQPWTCKRHPQRQVVPPLQNPPQRLLNTLVCCSFACAVCLLERGWPHEWLVGKEAVRKKVAKANLSLMMLALSGMWKEHNCVFKSELVVENGVFCDYQGRSVHVSKGWECSVYSLVDSVSTIFVKNTMKPSISPSQPMPLPTVTLILFLL
jgi:hypothetical protein